VPTPAPDRSGIPIADPARHGSGVYRRRIRIETVAPGVVVAELEDDYHHFRCTVRHDGEAVTACEGEAVRFPWMTCPGATALVGQLVGMPLSPRSTAVGDHADVGEQCTHLFDLAGLAVAHASAGRDRRDYAIDVPDRSGTSITLPVLERDGRTLLEWTVDGDELVAPERFAGHSLRRGFMAWAEQELDPDTAEAAIVLRRATMISWGRSVSLDAVQTAADLGAALQGRCHTFSEAHVHEAKRMTGTTLDFTDAAERLLAD
jgi:hypothetical protein